MHTIALFRSTPKNPWIMTINLTIKDLCTHLASMDQSPVLKWAIAKIGPSLAKQIHSCPYQVMKSLLEMILFLWNWFQGTTKVTNVTMRPEIGAFTPPGLYKIYIGLNQPSGILISLNLTMRVKYPTRQLQSNIILTQNLGTVLLVTFKNLVARLNFNNILTVHCLFNAKFHETQTEIIICLNIFWSIFYRKHTISKPFFWSEWFYSL